MKERESLRNCGGPGLRGTLQRISFAMNQKQHYPHAAVGVQEEGEDRDRADGLEEQGTRNEHDEMLLN